MQTGLAMDEAVIHADARSAEVPTMALPGAQRGRFRAPGAISSRKTAETERTVLMPWTNPPVATTSP